MNHSTYVLERKSEIKTTYSRKLAKKKGERMK